VTSPFSYKIVVAFLQKPVLIDTIWIIIMVIASFTVAKFVGKTVHNWFNLYPVICLPWLTWNVATNRNSTLLKIFIDYNSLFCK
jgi:hypothetical protein